MRRPVGELAKYVFANLCIPFCADPCGAFAGKDDVSTRFGVDPLRYDLSGPSGFGIFFSGNDDDDHGDDAN